jgi:hypothetical protein
MGKQYNKIEKRGRRSRYLKRKTVKARQPKPAPETAAS